MSFWDHLEELRWTLFRSILALFVFAIAGLSHPVWVRFHRLSGNV